MDFLEVHLNLEKTCLCSPAAATTIQNQLNADYIYNYTVLVMILLSFLIFFERFKLLYFPDCYPGP